MEDGGREVARSALNILAGSIPTVIERVRSADDIVMIHTQQSTS
jgi:hypothetical protein